MPCRRQASGGPLMIHSRRSFLRIAAAGAAGPPSLAGLVAGPRAWSREPERPPAREGEAAKVLAAMRALARSVRVREFEDDSTGRVLALREEPLLRYSDPARGI